MSYRSVSKKYGVFYDSVRTLYHRYVVSGWSGLQPHYERCGKVMPTHSDFRYRSTCWLKRLHPQWGAAFILVQLKQRYPFLVFPTVRTVQRWFAVEGLNVLHTRLPQNKQEKASEVHQILQVDAKENLHLADGSSACWLSIVDEKSGALLDALLFPHAKIAQVPLKDIQTTLIAHSFARWGLPQKMRFDNGLPFGWPDRTSVPVLSLWLLSIGIQIHYNHPHSPKENAKVERNQDITGRWSEYKQCVSYEQLQQKLNTIALIQREKYPLSRQNQQTRLELYPQLETKYCCYESQKNSLEPVLQFLAKGTYVRTVSKNNQFSLFGVKKHIPKGYAYQAISIQLDTEKNLWKITDRKGQTITQIQNDFISLENINQLTIRQRTKKEKLNLMSYIKR